MFQDIILLQIEKWVMCWTGTNSSVISLHRMQNGKSSHLWVLPITKGMDLEPIEIDIQCSMISED